MAITFVGAADLQASGATTEWTVSYTVGAGSNRLLVLAVGQSTNGDITTGATYGGVAMTLVNKALRDSGGWYVYHFALINPASGANNFVITTSAASFMYGLAADYAGVKQTGNPEANAIKEESATVDLDVTVTTLSDNAWTVLVAAGGGFDDMVAGSGTTRRAFTGAPQSDRLLGLFDSGSAITPASTNTLHCNYSDARNMGGVIAAYAPDTGAPPPASAGHHLTLLGAGN